MTARGVWLAAASTLWCPWALCGAQNQGPTPETLIQRGLMALQSRDVPAAQRLLERAVESAPTDARAWIGLAHTYQMLNLHAEAARHATEAERVGRDNPVIQHALAMFYSDYRDWARAAEWEERYARKAGDTDAYIRAVSLYLQADMPRRAAALGESALEMAATPALNNLLGKAYTMAGEVEKGLQHLQAAVENEPYDESLHYDLGYFHLRQQDFEAATRAFEEGRKYFDKSPALEIGLGIAAYGKREFHEAVSRFLRAAELAPQLEQPHAFLGRLLQHAASRIDHITERMRVFHTEHSKNHFGPFLYGQALLAQLGTRRDEVALARIEDLLRESIEREDEFWEAHYELGVLLEKRRDFAQAEEHLRRAADLNPSASKPHYRLARVYQRLGKTREARQEREIHKLVVEREREAMRTGGVAEELRMLEAGSR
ncbi:MAG: tetratricopeptide repeat protein [Bryobacterales bacterium]|nr:tetratricopeptide repeat protein [Bryobacterales bacterium]